jgi:hypothetical protein
MIGGAIAVVVTTGACSSSSGAGPASSSAPAPTPSTVISTSASASVAGSSNASLPKTCAQIPTSVLLPYAKVALLKSFPRTTPGVTCEFGSANYREVVILTIGPGSASAFAALEAKTRTAAVTTAPLHGVGQAAFTIGRGGKITGVDALTNDNATIALAASLGAGQVQRLAAKLASRY